MKKKKRISSVVLVLLGILGIFPPITESFAVELSPIEQHLKQVQSTLSSTNIPYMALYEEELYKIRNFDETKSYSSEEFGLYVMSLYLLKSGEMQELGYSLLDINDDGVPELFLGLIGEAGSHIALTIIDNQVETIAYRDYRFGASYTGSGTFYEWGSGSAFDSSHSESKFTGTDIQYNEYGAVRLDILKFYDFLSYDFMLESQHGYYTASTRTEIYSAVNNENINSLTIISDDVVTEFLNRMNEGYPFDYTPIAQSLQSEQLNEETESDRLIFAEETGLIFDSFYLSDPYPSYVTFKKDGTYTLITNLGVGYGMDTGTYSTENKQIICTVHDRNWKGFVWDDVDTYSFFVSDGKLTFHLTDGFTAIDGLGNNYILENLGDMKKGDTLSMNPPLPIATLYSSYLTTVPNMSETATLISGSLPLGLGIYPDGTIGGIPTVTGNFSFIISLPSGGVICHSIEVQENTSVNVEADNDFHIIQRIETVDSNEKEYVFEVAGVYSNFLNVYLDGVLLIPEVEYSPEEGSTKITIFADTMAQLNSGYHTINATFVPVDVALSSNITFPNVTVEKVAQTFEKTIAKTTEPAMPFTDVGESDWFYDYVLFVYKKGTFGGTSATTYSPNTSMNRAMMATVLYALADRPTTEKANLSDVPDGVWYDDAVNWVVNKGIDNSTGTFRPEDAITREETAQMLYNFCTDQGFWLPLVTSATANDMDSVSKSCTTAVDALYQRGIFAGDNNGNFNPTTTSNRDAIAVIMKNFLSVVM